MKHRFDWNCPTARRRHRAKHKGCTFVKKKQTGPVPKCLDILTNKKRIQALNTRAQRIRREKARNEKAKKSRKFRKVRCHKLAGQHHSENRKQFI